VARNRSLRTSEESYGYERPYYDEWGSERDPMDSKWVDPSRTDEKSSHPYSYSEFFIFGGHKETKLEGVVGIYSDRINQWWYDEKKTDKEFDALWAKHVGTRYALANAAKLSAFFTAYNQILWPKKHKNKKVKVVALAEGCNASNGYPYWIIWYVES
jgi:hypothetical protein